jgi:hypothetical protein
MKLSIAAIIVTLLASPVLAHSDGKLYDGHGHGHDHTLGHHHDGHTHHPQAYHAPIPIPVPVCTSYAEQHVAWERVYTTIYDCYGRFVSQSWVWRHPPQYISPYRY